MEQAFDGAAAQSGPYSPGGLDKPARPRPLSDLQVAQEAVWDSLKQLEDLLLPVLGHEPPLSEAEEVEPDIQTAVLSAAAVARHQARSIQRIISRVEL